MALAKTLRQRLYDLFALDGGGDTAIRTTGTGTFTPSGLRVAIKITNMTVDDTPDPIPAVALTGRNSLILENRGAVTIYVGDINVTASGVNEGWAVDPSSSLSFDISDTITLYAIAPAAQTVAVKVMELA